MANVLQIVIICSSIFTLLPPSLAQVDYFAHGAVVRPTIFSGLPKDSPTDSQISPLSPQQKNNQQHQQANQDGAPPAQKINPLKSRFCTGPNGQRLDHALGLQSFEVDNLSLTASSFSNEQVRPHLARLNQDNLGGAWCPRRPISSADFGKEWIQVKLNGSFVVTAIETQGRFALGSGKEFVPNYQVEYSRNNGLTWHKWKDFRGSSLLKANEDVQTAVRNEFSPPIVGANVIRILPYSLHLRTVCMRFELYGCQYDEGAPISYTTQDGVVEPRWGHLIDYTYDGLRHKNGQLSGGLGQLVDGVKGPDNFLHNTGFEWVGWKSKDGDVVIEFTYKTLRNFTGALFYSNNLFSSGVEVFQAVDVHYGIDINLSTEALKDSLIEQRRRTQAEGAGNSIATSSGALSRAARQLVGSTSEDQQQAPLHSTVWSSDVLSIEYEPDKKVESSRPVTVHLRQRLANKLRFVLKFASKWILISEVEFLSHPVELMSLASLNEQLTPKLMVDLQQAKTYDQYVAILREHQLRRIAADEYLNMGGVSTTTSASATYAGAPAGPSDSTSETPAIMGGPVVVDGQQAEQASSGSSDTNKVIVATDDSLMEDSYNQMMLANSNNNKHQRNQFNQWLPNGAESTLMNTQFTGLPSTNPLLNNQPPFSDNNMNNIQLQPSLIFDKINNNSNSVGSAATNDLLAQHQSRNRTVGLATVISFVFVGIIAFLGTLFAVSSYRLRQAHPKLGSPTALPHHFAATSIAEAGANKGFMTGVFASSSPSAARAAAANSSHSTSSSTASGSGANTMNNYHNHNHDHMAPRHLIGAGQLSDQHYNPLFAASSGRSSEGSLKKSSASTGPLNTLKRLAQLTTSGAGTAAKKHRHQQQQQQTLANANLLFSSAVRHQEPNMPPTGHHQYHHQNQLLVSLKDSISGNGKVPSSQTINTQLIVGLNQANPLAHQQIYNNNNNMSNQIYNQQQPAANYSVTTNSLSLASSSTTGNANSQHNNGAGDYSLATSSAGGDYATPDIQPIIQSSSTNLINPASSESRHFLANHKFPLINTADHLRNSRRFNQTINRTMHHQQHQHQQQLEHNYEQIASDHQQQPQATRLSGTGTMMAHNRTFSNQHQPQACLINSMTIGQGNVIDSRTTRQPIDASSSHYCYADTDPAQSCNAR